VGARRPRGRGRRARRRSRSGRALALRPRGARTAGGGERGGRRGGARRDGDLNLFIDGFYQRHFWILLACAFGLPVFRPARRPATAVWRGEAAYGVS